jgi:hypothetical protein
VWLTERLSVAPIQNAAASGLEFAYIDQESRRQTPMQASDADHIRGGRHRGDGGDDLSCLLTRNLRPDPSLD